jgi:hypothetical protein
MTQNAFMRLVRNVFRGDRRRASRYFVELPDGVVAGPAAPSGPQLTAVTIHDLSLTGALIEGPDLPQPGATVTLTRDSLEIAATVAWNDGARAGLKFHRALAVEQLFTIIHSAQFRGGSGVPAALAA